MEQTIKINVPEGKIVKYNKKTRTIEFIDKNPIRSKSWEEFCKNHPITTSEYYINDNGKIYPIDTCNRLCANNLKTKEDAEGILALIQLTRLHDEWVPSKSKEVYPIVCDSEGTLYVYKRYLANSRLLTFPTIAMAEEFLECFRDLIKKARKFI